MTNKHCDDCGDPVFRYDGQEFCPSCGREVAEGGRSEGTAEADTEGVGAAEGTSGDAGSVAPQTEASTGETGGAVDQRAGSAPVRDGNRSVESPPPQGEVAGGDLQTARAALVRKLARLAQQAEATDDVNRSRDLLAAAKEAAEALAAVDRARR